MKSDTLHIGIDPGLKGGIATIFNNKVSNIIDMPTLNNDIHFAGIVEVLQKLHNENPNADMAIGVEVQFYTSEDGKDRIWKTAIGYKSILDAISTAMLYLDLPIKSVRLVRSQEWKGYFSVLSTSKDDKVKDKKIKTRDKVIELYGNDLDLYGPKGGMRDGRSDSILIARYVEEHS